MSRKPANPRPSGAAHRLRIDEIVQIRLEGATCSDVRGYIEEKCKNGVPPWATEPNTPCLSIRQVREYIVLADKRMAQESRASIKKSLALHLAKIQYIYANAVNRDDYRTALAALREEAEVRRLYDYTPDGQRIEQPKTAADAVRILGQMLVKVTAGTLDYQTASSTNSLTATFLKAVEVADLASQIAEIEIKLEELINGGSGRINTLTTSRIVDRIALNASVHD